MITDKRRKQLIYLFTGYPKVITKYVKYPKPINGFIIINSGVTDHNLFTGRHIRTKFIYY